ncbi:MAG: hypothetical protein ACRDYF_02850 [Acidimicrobiia bacterium]
MLRPDDAALLEDLAEALTTDPLPEPPRHDLELLRAAIAFHLEPPGRAKPVPASRQRLAARRTARVGTMAASFVMLLTSAAAAAGVASDGISLPRPVRAVADAVGLPVDSVALDDTHQHLQDLRDAVRSEDHHRVERVLAKLRVDLSRLPENERRGAQPEVETAVAQAAASVNAATVSATTAAEHRPVVSLSGPAPTPPPAVDGPEPLSADAATTPMDTGDGRGADGDEGEVTVVESAAFETGDGPESEEQEAAPTAEDTDGDGSASDTPTP